MQKYQFWRCYLVCPMSRYIESMANFAAAVEIQDAGLQSLAFEHCGSFLYLAGDTEGSLEAFRWACDCRMNNIPLPLVTILASARSERIAPNDEPHYISLCPFSLGLRKSYARISMNVTFIIFIIISSH